MRISDWSSDVCSSDLSSFEQLAATQSNIGRMVEAGVEVGIGMLGEDEARQVRLSTQNAGNLVALNDIPGANGLTWGEAFAAISRSEEHTPELQSLMRISYAVFCLKKKKKTTRTPTQ